MKGFCVLLHLNTLFMNQECRRKQSKYSNLNKQCHAARELKNTNRPYLNEYSQTTSIAKCTVVDVAVRIVIVIVVVIVIIINPDHNINNSAFSYSDIAEVVGEHSFK